MGNGSKLNIALLCAASVVALTTNAFGQDADRSAGVESVTVTGSRVISDIANSPTPLTVVTTDELLSTTPATIPDALNKLPVFLGSNSQRTSGNAQNNRAGNVLNLRNFGANRTLVLLDGHRVAPSNFDGTVDTDVLPQMLVSRVEVVTGGASAVYGSDAVTGVVNFVLDKKFNGFKYSANAGISKYSDAAAYQAGIAAGTDIFNGRGHIEGSLRFYNQDKVPKPSRPYGSGGQSWMRSGNGSAANPYTYTQYGRRTNQGNGGGILTCKCSANNTTFLSNGVLGPFNFGTPTGTPNISNGGDGGGYWPTSEFQASLHTAEAFGRMSYDVSETVTAYVQVTASQATNYADFTALTLNPGAGRGTIFDTNNAFLSDSAKAALKAGNPGTTFTMAKFFDNVGGVPALATGSLFGSGSVDRNLGATIGLSGTIAKNYSWDAYFTHGQSRQEEYIPHNENVQKLVAAEDAVLDPSGKVVCNVSLTAYANLYPGCVPINPFGPTSLTLEQFNYISSPTSYVITNIMNDIGGSVSGEFPGLPAGPIKAALSAEARWQSLNVKSAFRADAVVDCTGLRLCVNAGAPAYDQSNVGATRASNNVYEIASEINIPLLKDVPLIQQLNLDLAGRFTNYSTSGDAETWKIGLDYHVNDSIRFRGTASVDIRAPNLFDLYAPTRVATGAFNDLLTGQNINMAFSTVANANLRPEVAHTHTAGIVLTPEFLPGFTASVDYYRINMSSAITTINPTSPDIQKICIATSGAAVYCAQVDRPFAWTNTTPANFPTTYRIQAVNSANVDTEGTDIELDYSFDMADIISGVPGNVSLRNMTSYQPHVATLNYPNAPVTQNVMPKLRNSAFVSYKVGDWGFNIQDTWFSGFSPKSLATDVYAIPRRRSFNSVDMTVDKQLFTDTNELDLYFSVQNVFNAQPDIYTTEAVGGITYPVMSSENAMGRYFTIGIRGAL
jgi:iron complex outermembrane receptor protein